MRIVVGVTGASGVIYGIKLLEALGGKAERHLIVSSVGEKIIENEIGKVSFDSIAEKVYDNSDLFAPVSSGSYGIDATVVVPCSLKTLSAVSTGYSSDLITRVAVVALKESRRLVLVPRETPLGLIDIENLLRVKRAGAIVLPACPGYYHEPESIDDLVNFIVGKILDSLGIEHDLFKRWNG